LSLKDAKGDKTTIAKMVGVELGKLAVEKGIVEVFFDRGSNKYHGRIRALAEGLRDGGLKF
jgi:large subunit ribosomal protein L18